ncbi:MAG: glycosyl hydrolase [Kiritimatiellae bacterium]|nr:glycosyl hydrolase [Kiritimatiellia bacterium]
MKTIKKLVLALAVACIASNAAAATLDADFMSVPDQSKPWAYWWWLNGNVDKETITSDLEAMKRVGFGGLLMFDSRGYHDNINHVVLPKPQMEFMSDEWQEMLTWGIIEAGRLGLEVSVNLSTTAGSLKGPWPVGETAPKRMVWRGLPLKSGERYSAVLKHPEDRKYFWDIAAVAVKHDGDLLEPMQDWINAGDGPMDGWSGKKIGKTVDAAPRTVLEAIDLTDKIDANGVLNWQVPEGQWSLLRFGFTTIDGHEYDVDMMDSSAVEGHFNRMGGRIIKNAGPLAGKTLTHFYNVSWEGSVPTWTASFEQEFDKYRGYSIRPWLPVLAGFFVKSPEATARFMKDYRATRNNVFRENFYGTMQKLCHKNGLKWHSESGGPWNRAPEIFGEAGQMTFLARNDTPQGEFWYTGAEGYKGRQMSRPPAMVAHTYGKRIAAAEAFTHMVRHWTPYPALLKRCSDESFIDGVNHLIWHTFTCSPKRLGLPGSEYFAGTHINPNVTWFEQSKPFITYLGRCQHLLQQGLFVADVCVFTGDIPYQHWGRFTTKWSSKATMELPAGHGYDIFSTEVLLERAKVKDGNIVLPDGMSYHLLVVDLDDEIVSLKALKRVAELKAAGALVVFGSRKPTKAYNMSATTVEDDRAVQQLGLKLWANSPTLEEALKTKKLTPDFEGPFEYTHRRSGAAEIYFVVGSGKSDCAFRVEGKQPELWNPVTGEIEDINGWQSTVDGRTQLTLDLPEFGSAFVIFRKAGVSRPAKTPVAKSGTTDLSGAWKVTFMPGRGAPAEAVFDPLMGWSEHKEFGIRHFSGTATYHKSFEVAAKDEKKRAWLELGTVAALAQVRLNGKDLGIVWTAPWRIELTNALKSGENKLEIEVTNPWANRMVGDASLPPEQRITRSNMQYQKGEREIKAFQGFASSDALQPSGLKGPVQVEFFEE